MIKNVSFLAGAFAACLFSTASAFAPLAFSPGNTFVPKAMTSDSISKASFFQPKGQSHVATQLAVQTTPNDTISPSGTPKVNLAPSAIFLAFAGTLGKLLVDIQGAELPMTIGTCALLVVTAAVAYDNLIIGLGPFLFDETSEKSMNLLKILSFPRFTLHAVGVPFLCATAAEIGQAASVGWLQSESIQTAVLALATIVAIIDRTRFVNSPGIELADTSDSPSEAKEHDLLWFTYKEPLFLYVLPSIVLSLFNLVVGGAAYLNGDERTAATYLIASAVAVLAGNAQPSHITRFTGNLGEVAMLWLMFESMISLSV